MRFASAFRAIQPRWGGREGGSATEGDPNRGRIVPVRSIACLRTRSLTCQYAGQPTQAPLATDLNRSCPGLPDRPSGEDGTRMLKPGGGAVMRWGIFVPFK